MTENPTAPPAKLKLVADDSNSEAVLRDLSGSGAGRRPEIRVVVEPASGPNFTVRVGLPDQELPVGTLVELSLPERLYLGEIVARGEKLAVIRPEHTLKREALDDIRKNWKTS